LAGGWVAICTATARTEAAGTEAGGFTVTLALVLAASPVLPLPFGSTALGAAAAEDGMAAGMLAAAAGASFLLFQDSSGVSSPKPLE
jgi:hypothetical protein